MVNELIAPKMVLPRNESGKQYQKRSSGHKRGWTLRGGEALYRYKEYLPGKERSVVQRCKDVVRRKNDRIINNPRGPRTLILRAIKREGREWARTMTSTVNLGDDEE